MHVHVCMFVCLCVCVPVRDEKSDEERTKEIEFVCVIERQRQGERDSRRGECAERNTCF